MKLACCSKCFAKGELVHLIGGECKVCGNTEETPLYTKNDGLLATFWGPIIRAQQLHAKAPKFWNFHKRLGELIPGTDKQWKELCEEAERFEVNGYLFVAFALLRIARSYTWSGAYGTKTWKKLCNLAEQDHQRHLRSVDGTDSCKSDPFEPSKELIDAWGIEE